MSTDTNSEVSYLQAPLTDSKILAIFLKVGNDKISGASDHVE